LTEVLQSLLTFEGAEFYFKAWPELTGVTFGEVCFRFPDAIVLGVKPFNVKEGLNQIANSRWGSSVESKMNRKIFLNPPDDYVVRDGDLICVLADDDDSYAPRQFVDVARMKEALSAMNRVRFTPPLLIKGQPESFLFCGSRRDMDDMIDELEKTVAPGSTLTLMSHLDIDEQKERLAEGGLDLSRLKNLNVYYFRGNHVLRRDLEKLPLETYSSILILAEEEFENNIDEADSRTLTCLLLIRDIISKRTAPPSSIPSSPISNGNGNSMSKLRLETQQSGQSPPALPPTPSTAGQAILSRRRRIFRKISTGGRSGDSTDSPPVSMNDPSASSPIQIIRRTVGGDDDPSGVQTIILCEILDTQTKALMPIAKVNDNLLSNEIVSACISMISESASTNDVLSELLHPEGNDIKVVCSLEYGQAGDEISLWDLSSRARSRGELLLGYNYLYTGGAVLNPTDKSKRIKLDAKTYLVIIAEDRHIK